MIMGEDALLKIAQRFSAGLKCGVIQQSHQGRKDFNPAFPVYIHIHVFSKARSEYKHEKATQV
jgi:hypothetical protein